MTLYIVPMTLSTISQATKRHRYDVAHRFDDIANDISRHQTTSLRCRTSCRRHRLRHFTTPNDIVTMSYIGSTTSPTTFQDTKRHRYDVVHRVDDIAYDMSRHQTTSLRCRTSGRRHRLRHFKTSNDIATMSHIGSETSPTILSG